MAIASPERTYRLRLFRQWFNEEISFHPYDRTRHSGHLNTRFTNHQRQIIKLIEELQLAKKSNSKKVAWKGYVNIPIPTKMVERAERFCKDSDNVFSQMNQLIYEGYSIKFVQGSEEGQIRCNLYCADPDSDNAGLSLGAWAGDWYTALAVAIFKHQIVAKGLWDGYEKPDLGSFG